MRLIEIEFIKDTFSPTGEPLRYAGQRVRVDPMSMRSFVDVKKVARIATDPAIVHAEAEDTEVKAPEAKKPAGRPKPNMAEPVEGDDTDDADDD
ncbi:hypothetical protein [Mycolicibacterium peregrinum]|uniref:hypothetical protein n=1 Tax=Mycolicibacterium peregrinum TaxID=43304 RepID=UPI003AACEEA7